MIEITYTGWVVLFCIILLLQTAFLVWAYHKITSAIKNHKDQMIIDNRSLATLIQAKQNCV